MALVDGALPANAQDAFPERATRAAKPFRAHGALLVVECWGDDPPEGKRNPMHRPVLHDPGETAVLSRLARPWRAARVGNGRWPIRTCRPRPNR